MFNSLAGLLVSLTSPILIRVLAKLGMGIISYAGFEYLLTKLQEMLKSYLNGMIADILAILGVGGVRQWGSLWGLALPVLHLNKLPDWVYWPHDYLNHRYPRGWQNRLCCQRIVKHS